MRRLICRLFGHDWVWIDYWEPGMRKVYHECARCGKEETLLVLPSECGLAFGDVRWVKRRVRGWRSS